MATSYKKRSEADSAKLSRIRELLAEASALAISLDGTSQAGGAVFRYLLGQTSDQAKELHEHAHFSATGELL